MLALLHRDLAPALPVPVATSSLPAAASIKAMLPRGRRLGVLTFAVEAVLCEGETLPPHAASIAAATGLPVHDIVGVVDAFARSPAPPRYPAP